MATPEGRVKAMVNRRLAELKRLYRFMPIQNGMGAPGLDYFLCAGGWFIAIETKAPGKKPTPRQEVTMQAICDAHGLVFVVDDEASCDVAMKTIAACCLLADEIRAEPNTEGGKPKPVGIQRAEQAIRQEGSYHAEEDYANADDDPVTGERL